MVRVIKYNCFTGSLIETIYSGDELHVAFYDANLYNTSNRNYFAHVVFGED